MISDYPSLQTAVANWLVRSDLVARTLEFIQLGEVRLNRVLRTRRAEMDVALTGVLSSRLIPLPSAYSEALTLWVTPPSTTVREELRFMDPATFIINGIAAKPKGWTIDGANLGFDCPCDKAYPFTLRCIERYALSDAVPTNNLLTDYPDAYLFAALCEAAPFLRDDKLMGAYEGKLTRAIDEINAKEARSRAQQKLSTEPGQLQFAGRRSGYNAYTDGLR